VHQHSAAWCAGEKKSCSTAPRSWASVTKQTTADGLFTLEEVECIGACSWAPAAQVNYDFHENLTAEKMDRILDDYKKKAAQ